MLMSLSRVLCLLCAYLSSYAFACNEGSDGYQGDVMIGINSNEIRQIQKIIRHTETFDWFNRLSNDAKRVLSDRTASMVIVSCEGLYYRSGLSDHGNVHALSPISISRSDYNEIKSGLNDPYLRQIFLLSRAAVGNSEMSSHYISAYKEISQDSNPERKNIYMAILGDYQERLSSQDVSRIYAIDEDMISVPLNSYAIAKKSGIDKALSGDVAITKLGEDEASLYSNKIRYELRNAISQDGSQKVVSFDLDDNFQALISLDRGDESSLGEPSIDLFVGPSGASFLERVDPSQLQNIIEK